MSNGHNNYRDLPPRLQLRYMHLSLETPIPHPGEMWGHVMWGFASA